MAAKLFALTLLPLLLITASAPLARAQNPDKDILPLDKINDQAELDRTITVLDAELFDAYNTCKLEKFGSLIDENVEFFHDKAGNTFGRAALVEAIKENICGKVTRELVPDTLKVYPMKGYGALEIGVHRFHHPGQVPDVLGEASFIQLWQYKDGAWKITRVISYDHHPAGK
ncbi:MAG TPA: nuclear transport factor 2 family protein [Terriglobales bacterium]|nr:nuclear transport factor 2 family protein [Terriglobales bacterium]